MLKLKDILDVKKIEFCKCGQIDKMLKVSVELTNAKGEVLKHFKTYYGCAYCLKIIRIELS